MFGPTTKSLRKHPPQSIAMAKGHLDQIRKNQRSTKTPVEPPTSSKREETDDFFPTSPDSEARTHFCYAVCLEYIGQIFTDQTGRFIVLSSTGYNQLFVLYDYDSNSIWEEPIKSKSGPVILAAYTKVVHKRLLQSGLRPILQRLDNECSEILKEFMKKEEVDYQLVPPSDHCRNAAKRAIRTLKNRFVASICSTDKNFPLHLWDRLLPQALLSLNLLRDSQINPKLSAWAQVNGLFDYNRTTPLAPPGICVLVVHEKPSAHDSWSPHHGVNGWYIGPALESYR